MAQHDPREPAEPTTVTNDVQTDELPSQTGGGAGPQADTGRNGLGAGRDDARVRRDRGPADQDDDSPRS